MTWEQPLLKIIDMTPDQRKLNVRILADYEYYSIEEINVNSFDNSDIYIRTI